MNRGVADHHTQRLLLNSCKVLTPGRGEEVNNYRVLATDYETFSIEYQCLELVGSGRDGKGLLVRFDQSFLLPVIKG